MYKLKMNGTDPEGKSSITGYAAYKDERMAIALAQTHGKHQKK